MHKAYVNADVSQSAYQGTQRHSDTAVIGHSISWCAVQMHQHWQTILQLQMELYASCCHQLWHSRASCPEGVALVASGVPNQVQAGTGDVHHPHTSVPRLPDRFCTPLQQQWSSTLSAPLGDRHQLLCSMYEDEIWRQSFLCGRASSVEQFASGNSSRGQSTLF